MKKERGEEDQGAVELTHNELVADDDDPGDDRKIDWHPARRGRHFRWPLNTMSNEMATGRFPEYQKENV